MDYGTIISRVKEYNSILKNTKKYRKAWGESIRPMIIEELNKIIEETKLNAFVEIRDDIENLEVIALSLGTVVSSIAEKLPGNRTKRSFIKSSGALIFQQLFNGKIMMMVMYPYIEGYGQPKPPRSLEILRPKNLSVNICCDMLKSF